MEDNFNGNLCGIVLLNGGIVGWGSDNSYCGGFRIGLVYFFFD